jgi:hypothetical protein
MSRAVARVGMAPPRSGTFVCAEMLDELGLTVSAAAKCSTRGAPPCPT